MHEKLAAALEAPTSPELMRKADWQENVVTQVELAETTGEPLSVVFIDVNYFKDINDTLGHQTGDKVINDIERVVGFVAENLRIDDGGETQGKSKRPSDLVAHSSFDPEKQPTSIDPGRIGGDEFAVLAKTDAAGAKTIVDRLREAFTDYIDLPKNDELKTLGIGLAIGAATFESGMTSSELLQNADEAMYANKNEQLTPLTEKQEKAMLVARTALEAEGIRLRDLPKYQHLLLDK